MSGGAIDASLGDMLEIIKVKDALADVSGCSSLTMSEKV
jgi:hypothetical protein